MSPAPHKPLRGVKPEEDQYLAAARLEFLVAVDEVRPAAATALAKDVGSAGTGPDYERSLSVGGPKTDVRHEALQQRAEVLTELDAWGDKYHLRDPWILDHALQLLLRHQDNLEGLKKLAVDPGAVTYTPPTFAQTVPPPEYRPDQETLNDYIERAWKYVAEVEAAWEDAGWQIELHKPHLPIHLRWLARFQVGGETVESIAESGRVDKRDVRRALKGTAKLIDVKRRR